MMYLATLNVVFGFVNYSVWLIDNPSVIVLSISVWLVTAICIYSVYIGYMTDRETDLDDIYKQLPPETRDYD